MHFNTLGTFGVSSESYYWSRTAGALGGLTQYLATPGARTWHMLVADDYMLEAYRHALCRVLCPLLSPGCSTLVEQDGRERHDCVGGVRAAAARKHGRNLSASSGLVRQVVNGGGGERLCAHVLL